MTGVPVDLLARGTACLFGLAIGDALGMPTQLLSREEVRLRYGFIDGFERPADDHPLVAERPAGSTTDDTDQAILLAEVLIEGRGKVDPTVLARRLAEWERTMRERGSADLLGPSTRAALRAMAEGTPAEIAGRQGITNGAAMRVAPVGLLTSSDDLPGLVDLVEQSCLATHHTGVAIAGAAAVAAAVSAGLEGHPLPEVIHRAIAAAELGSHRGRWVKAGDVARRIAWAAQIARVGDPEHSLNELYRLIGTSLATQESVPMAFGLLALFPGAPWRVVCTAATLGGDSDTIAAMAGAVAGAVYGPGAWPERAVATVRRVNGLELERLVARLLALRLVG
jgi:ADP-ribosylglycohydrolase